MSGSDRILVVVDPTAGEDQVVLERSKILALALGKKLELLICYYDQYLGSQAYMGGADVPGLRQQMITLLRKKLDDYAVDLRDAGIEVDVTVIWDQPLHEAVARFVEITEPFMVIKETHYHSKLSRAVFTHTDWNLLRNCIAPLWLAKSRPWNPEGDVIACVDPMQEHDKPATLDGMILDQAGGVAQGLGSKLRVFHSYHLPVPSMADGVMMPTAYRGQEVEKQFQRQHRKALNRLLESREIPDEQVHMQSGATHVVLPEFVDDRNASLVVMGAVARSSVKRAFIGSTAERVLPRVPCDLLVIKPDWFEHEVEAVKPEVVDTSREVEAWGVYG